MFGDNDKIEILQEKIKRLELELSKYETFDYYYVIELNIIESSSDLKKYHLVIERNISKIKAEFIINEHFNINKFLSQRFTLESLINELERSNNKWEKTLTTLRQTLANAKAVKLKKDIAQKIKEFLNIEDKDNEQLQRNKLKRV